MCVRQTLRGAPVECQTPRDRPDVEVAMSMVVSKGPDFPSDAHLVGATRDLAESLRTDVARPACSYPWLSVEVRGYPG